MRIFFLCIIIVINLLIRAFHFYSFFFVKNARKLFLDFWTFGNKNKYLRIEYFIYSKVGFKYLDHRRVDILISLEILLVRSLSIFRKVFSRRGI